MAEEKIKEEEKEGQNLLGPPTYTNLNNGRFKCVETGHELPAKETESYGQTKRCRLGLINYFLLHKKSPLNLFKQDPLNKSKLICKLTGDIVNKSEEHIWKHISGRRFLNKLELKEAGKLTSNGKVIETAEEPAVDETKPSSKNDKKNMKKMKKKKKKKIKKEKEVIEIISEVVAEASEEDNADEEDVDFWMPSPGSRWDLDDGGERWDSGSESEHENDEGSEGCLDEEEDPEPLELPTGKKRISTDAEPKKLAPKKKKSKKNPAA